MIRVVMSPAKARDQTNPFVDTLADSLAARGVAVTRFTWPKALLSRYDILHVHWPEALVRSHSRFGRVVKPALLIVLLAIRPLAGRKHVSTIHNLAPHESGSKIERELLRWWIASCSVRVYLTQPGLDSAADPRGVVVPHGDYEPLVSKYTTDAGRPTVPGRLLLFGQLRPYKGIEALIRSAIELNDPSVTLHVVGKSISAEYGAQLASQVSRARASHIVLQADKPLTDAELIAEIAASEIVVLPYQRIYNSGAAFLALTVGRPLIVTSSPSMIALQEEVGGNWVQLLDGGLRADTLARAIETLRNSHRGERPPMPGRNWARVAAQYEQAYQLAQNRTAGRG